MAREAQGYPCYQREMMMMMMMMNLTILFTVMGKIVGQIGFFSLAIATDGEGKV